jgi:ketosteroid isomerase-like protein
MSWGPKVPHRFPLAELGPGFSLSASGRVSLTVVRTEGVCGETSSTRTYRVTNVWRKENGKWKVIHIHISFPTDMATGKADMQSKL